MPEVSFIVRCLVLACITCSCLITYASASDCPGQKPALVTGGGGTRGAYQAGAVWYIVNVLGCPLHFFVGTSTGALAAAMLAQSSNHEDLKGNVDRLIETYSRLEHQDDIVERYSFGLPRLLLPKFLGGIDGLHSLAPIVREIDRQVDFEQIQRQRFDISAVSLQVGRINIEDALSLRDLVIASASIPIAIEPRRAQIWQDVQIRRFIPPDQLHLHVSGKFGLPDPMCQVRLKNAAYRCDVESAHVNRSKGAYSDSLFVSADYVIRVRDLPERTVHELLAQYGEITGRGEIPLRWRTEAGHDVWAPRMSMVHQLVDGGVTENLPVQRAMIAWENRIKRLEPAPFDIVFALDTGPSADNVKWGEPVEGVFNIAAASFEQLWRQFREKAILADSVPPNMLQLAHRLSEYVRSMSERVKLMETMLTSEQRRALAPEESIDPIIADLLKMGADKAHRGVPLVVVVAPHSTPFQDTLEVDRPKIQRALRDGCKRAAVEINSIREFVDRRARDIGADDRTCETRFPVTERR